MLNKPQAYLTKVFIQIFLRNKQYIVFSLILPLLILAIVGLNDGDNDPIEIGIANNSKSNLSQQFVGQLTSNKLFNIDLGLLFKKGNDGSKCAVSISNTNLSVSTICDFLIDSSV